MNIFELLFIPFYWKKDHKKELKNKTTETKKCLDCLRRINIENIKCPYCKTDNFQF